MDHNDPRKRILQSIIILLCIGLTLGGIIMAVLIDPLALVIHTALVMLLLPVYLLMRRDHMQLASMVLVSVLWLAITGGNYLLGGVQSPLFGAYSFIIVLGVLLLGYSGGIAAVIGSSIATFMLYILRDILPTYDIAAIDSTVLTIINYTIIAALIMIALYYMRIAFNQVIQSEAKQRQTISDLKHTIASKDYIENIIQSMSNLLFVLDSMGKITTVNKTALDLLGYGADELVGQPFYTILSGNSEAKTSLTTTLRDEDVLCKAKNGALILLNMSTSIMRDQNKRTRQIVCVAQDARRRREVEERIQYQSYLLQNVSDAIIAMDMNLTITAWNNAAESVYGWTAEEAIGQNMTRLLQSHDDSDNDEIIQQSVSKGNWLSEVSQTRKDGTTLYISSSISLLKDSEDKPVGLVAVNHDITKRRRAELALKKRIQQLDLLRNIGIEINRTLDINEVMGTALKEAVRVSGATDGFLLVMNETDDMRVIHKYGGYETSIPTQVGKIHGVVRRAMDRCEPQFSPDVSLDPDYVPDQPDTQAIIAIPLIVQDRLLGVLNLETSQLGAFTVEIFDFLKILAARIASAVDNARLYQLSQAHVQELQRLYEKVSNLEQLKTDMIQIASHDLRNPIGLVNGYLQLIQMDIFERLSPDEIMYFDEIHKAMERMNNIVTDILSLERIQKIADHDYQETVDLVALAQRILPEYATEAEGKSLKLHVRLPVMDVPITVRGDEAQLYEVMANLVNNAIKYTPEGGGGITIEVVEEAGDAIVLVHDQGYGVPEVHQKRLFQPFYRAKTDETAEVEGTGLGLHLVKNIIERHDGEVVFYSVHGKGSTFGFKIPLARTPLTSRV